MANKSRDVLFGGLLASAYRETKFTDNDSTWILKNQGNNQSGAQFLEREIRVASWKQMAIEAAYCTSCGKPIATNSMFCLNCGAKKTANTREMHAR